MNLTNLWQQYQGWLTTSGVRVLIIVVGALLVTKIGRLLIARFFGALRKPTVGDEMRKRTETLASLIQYVITVAVFALALMMILDEFGVEIGPILAAAGILGLALGFGAQHLVQDIINGFFILLEDQVRVGDVIETAGKSGIVEKVNLRLVVLRDLAGRVHYIPNGKIDIVTNMTKEFSYALLNIGVAYREDIDEVSAVMVAVDEEMRRDPELRSMILEPIEILGLDEFADSAIVIKARVKTQPIKQWKVAREFRRRLKKQFDKQGIEIPFPHVTLYMGQDKKGDAPPIHVSVDRTDGG
ncbi:MAG TPA: mechanosensitive ion channel family protein [Acidobacteriota bacterium]|nr:mechanosensitive ion channel family protein [Acidobacteriota bacterium]